MAKVKMTETKPGSIHVSLGAGGDVDKIEAYFGFEAEYLGKCYSVSVTADRYRASNGLTDWRLITRSGYSGPQLTDKGRWAAQEAIAADVLAWLHSDAGQREQQRATFEAIRRAIAEERYSVDRPRRFLAMHSTELADADRASLENSLTLLAAFLDSLKDEATA